MSSAASLIPRPVRLVLKRVAAVGNVHPVVMVVIVPFAISSIVLDCVTAHVYSRMDASPAVVHVAHITNALYVAGALEALLGLMLVLRGTWPIPWYRDIMAQIVLTGLALVPAVLVTALWAARVMVGALVLETHNVDSLHAGNPYVKASWSLLTATMVFSNLFAASTLSIIYANSAHFLAAKEDLQQDARGRMLEEEERRD